MSSRDKEKEKERELGIFSRGIFIVLPARVPSKFDSSIACLTKKITLSLSVCLCDLIEVGVTSLSVKKKAAIKENSIKKQNKQMSELTLGSSSVLSQH